MTEVEGGMTGRVLTLEEVCVWRAAAARRGQRVVLTNGCFDLLHVGHVQSFTVGRSFGDCLLVGVNSDRSVAQLKGPGRPLVPEQERAALLAALRMVDAVTIFDEPTAVRLVEALRPDVYEANGFREKHAEFEAAGKAAIVEATEPEHVLPVGEPEVEHQVWVLRVS